jgi:diaminopimelate decarboxylase
MWLSLRENSREVPPDNPPLLFGTQTINARGHLEVGGVDAVELAERFGTPLYVVDEEALRLRCREYVQAFGAEAPGSVVYYAAKAFLCRAAAALAAEERLHIDVASTGELRVALSAGVRPETIVVHGNYKKDEDLTAALDARAGLIAIDSVDEMRALSALASARGIRQPAVLRLAPGIDPHTLDAISTGRSDTKFGITVENGAALAAAAECLTLPGINLRGVHAHIGSQVLTLEPYELLAEKVLDFAKAITERTGWTPGLVILGGGLGIRYRPEDHPPSVRDVARTMVGALRRGAAARGLSVPSLGVEPGRSIAGECGLTLYRIGPVKEVPSSEGGKRVYAAVDGGLSDNPRPLMYGATYPVLLADRAAERPGTRVRVAGRHCETDTLFDVDLPPPRPGNILAVLSTGAYNHVMASNYNFFCRPPVVFVQRGDARLVVRRETEEDLLRREI